jgi:hypothetical protein
LKRNRSAVGRQHVIDSLREFTVVEELGDGSKRAFFWRAEVPRGLIEGTDIFCMNDEGLITHSHVFIRPLVGIGAFAAAVGSLLARRRRPRLAFAASPVGASLPSLLKAVDVIGSRLVGLGSDGARPRTTGT